MPFLSGGIKGNFLVDEKIADIADAISNKSGETLNETDILKGRRIKNLGKLMLEKSVSIVP
jgi:hypothetical protein